MTVTEEGSISGTLQRSKKSKRNWKRLWFLLKDKVLYTYRAREVRGNMHSPLTCTALIHSLTHSPKVVKRITVVMATSRVLYRKKLHQRRCLCWVSQ